MNFMQVALDQEMQGILAHAGSLEQGVERFRPLPFVAD
jgi:hypothetical protein